MVFATFKFSIRYFEFLANVKNAGPLGLPELVRHQ